MELEFQFPDVGSWISRIQLPSPGGWSMDSNFRKLDVRLEQASLDQPSPYFFRAKTCQKTRKNGGFQEGEPPGRNARGNPWGPVRTRGGPHLILGLFSTGFVVVSDKCHLLFSPQSRNASRSEVGNWKPISDFPTPSFQNQEVGIWK